MFARLALLGLLAPVLEAARYHQEGASENQINPIRKVVTMLQNMQAKVMEQGKAEEELFEKFMCYCKNNKGTLAAGLDEAQSKIENLEASITESTEKKAQTEQSLKDHQASRDEAKEAMNKATAVREKEAADFKEENADMKANLAALGKATEAIAKGMAGSFLQTTAASSLKKFVMEKANLKDDDRQTLMSFLSGASDYSPASTEIQGILKAMKDDMQKDHDEAVAAEKAAIKTYEELMAAKTKEVDVLQGQIEAEMKRVGELGVEIASMKGDLEDTKESLAEDTKFLQNLEKDCETKDKEWEEIKAVRAQELVALSETIKVLNDDDALDLFKKTLPGTGSSFVQLHAKATYLRSRALAVIRSALATHPAKKALGANPGMGMLELALGSKQVSFEKVIKMIDEMVVTLKAEQKDDDSKKEYCIAELDDAEDKKKALDTSISNSEAAIEELKGSISTLKEEIEALKAGIKALDKSVEEATAQRKSENEEYKKLMADNTQAKEILSWAKNRLNKFYNPKLYKAPEQRPMDEQEAFAQMVRPSSLSLAQLSSRKDAPPPPPEAPGPYKKKGEESAGVISMIDLLVKDLDKEMTEADVTEKDSQGDYEEAMQQAAKKRATDSKSITDKQSSVASEEEMLQAEEDSKAGATKELMMTLKYISSLHGECDWLVKYYDVRKEARASEIDALGKAKAVLSGADYSLMQFKGHAFNK